MKILMISAEVVPYAKTGGLADAVSALAIALHKNGHDVRIVMPRYYKISRDSLELLEGPMGIVMGAEELWSGIYKDIMPHTKGTDAGKGDKDGLPVYFIDYEGAFGRDGIYGTPEEPDFADNPFRFSLLCNGAFQLCHKINWYPDVMHAHDWSAALVPVLLKFYNRKGGFEHTSSVLTVHNLGYQGVYGKHNYPVTGMEWEDFYAAGFEDWDRMNFLKAGLISSDVLTTVSPTYAKEIQRPDYGFRMDALLRHRNADLFGILNGVDTNVWNPETDPEIPAHYSVNKMQGKAINKAALQERMGLEVNPDVPLIGIVTRLADQKGVAELFAPSFGCTYKMCKNFNMQFVVLGSGEKWCENELQSLQHKLPNFRVYLGYDNSLSHLIEAGSDFFLMPSRYEPCGLNQMYSLLYGTLPIVRTTGGLADTVEQYDEATGNGTGFMLENLTPQSLYDTVGWAMYAWYNKMDHIEAMKKRAMKKKFGWDKSAKKYEDVYKNALTRL